MRARLTCPTLTVICTRLSQPNVGTVHLHRRRWRPRRLQAVVFENDHEGRVVVDPALVEELLGATSLMIAMAVIRRGAGASSS